MVNTRIKHFSNHTGILNISRYLVTLLLLLSFCQPAHSDSKLKIHGYFTQSFAISDGYQIFGIPSSGTTDYRTAAMLFSFSADETNSVKLQFRHRRYGLSPLSELERTLQMDWGFLKHDFSDYFSIKIGRILLPVGIYNEIRDVGVLLPFYQAPYTPYSEGNFTAKAIDGVLVSLDRELGKGWSVESNYFAGQSDWVEWYRYRNPFTGGVIDFTRVIEMRKSLGSRLWLNTPYNGFRVGGTVLTGNILYVEPDRSNINDKGDRLTLSLLSADYTQEKYFIRSEFSHLKSEAVKIGGYYAQIGYQVHEHLWLYAQHDRINFIDADFFGIFLLKDFQYHNDYSFGINIPYRNYILKAEAHLTSGFASEEPIDFNAPPLKTNFMILSLATSF